MIRLQLHAMANQTELRIVDGNELPAAYRELLRPQERVVDWEGNEHLLPQFFYEVPSWRQAKDIMLTPHFALAEMMLVDCREARLLVQQTLRYVPLAVGILARYLEDFREKAGGERVFISANGGYRSPAHRLSLRPGVHCWGTAADIYRVGDDYLDSREAIEKYGEIFASLGAEVYVAPYGNAPGETDDHLHVDIGYINITPRKRNEIKSASSTAESNTHE
jgi:hypothetical protein